MKLVIMMFIVCRKVNGGIYFIWVELLRELIGISIKISNIGKNKVVSSEYSVSNKNNVHVVRYTFSMTVLFHYSRFRK